MTHRSNIRQQESESTPADRRAQLLSRDPWSKFLSLQSSVMRRYRFFRFSDRSPNHSKPFYLRLSDAIIELHAREYGSVRGSDEVGIANPITDTVYQPFPYEATRFGSVISDAASLSDAEFVPACDRLIVLCRTQEIDASALGYARLDIQTMQWHDVKCEDDVAGSAA